MSAEVTVWSEGFLGKVAPPELKISSNVYFIMYNGVIQNIAYLCAIFTLFVYVNYYQNNQFY